MNCQSNKMNILKNKQTCITFPTAFFFLIVRHFKHGKKTREPETVTRAHFRRNVPRGQFKMQEKNSFNSVFFSLKIHVICTRYTTVNIGNHIIPFIKSKLFNSYCG